MNRITLFVGTLVLASAMHADAAARLVRSTSGGQGALQGNRYVIEDPRSAFKAGVDRQVVVFFEWEAAPGLHRCEATFRDPSGKTVLVVPAEQNAPSRRFGVYWSLTLSQAPALGLWAVEAKVDGEPAGVHTFQVTDAAGDVAVSTRRTYSTAELYARLQAATVSLEALRADGQRLWTASGFYLDDTRLLTTFQVVEGADRVRVVTPDGAKVETTEILAMNRRQDWVILRAPGANVPPTAVSRRAVSVGDRAVFLDASEDGSRTLQEVAIVGQRALPQTGPRLNVTATASALAVGSPLVDDFGEAIGLMGATTTPGIGLPSGTVRFRMGNVPQLSYNLALPLEKLPTSTTDPSVQLPDLRARGLVVPPMTPDPGILASGLGKQTGNAFDYQSEFVKADAQAAVQVQWMSATKREGEITFGVYDLDNKVLLQAKPEKVKVPADRAFLTSWKLPLDRLEPGVYRVDVVLGPTIVARSFLTLKE